MPPVPPNVLQLEAHRARESLRVFAEQAWPQVEGANPFVGGFHIDAICEHLQALYQGEIKRLVINVPPRHMKSLLACVFFPVWCWIQDASLRMLFASYSGAFSLRDAKKALRLMQSEWFRARFSKDVQLLTANPAAQKYETTAHGFRFSTSVAGQGTGEGGHILGIDDAHKSADAQSKRKREATEDWFRGTWSSRLNDQTTGRQFAIGQRQHEQDLYGVLLRDGGWCHLCLPAEYVPTAMVTGIGWKDPRTEKGQLLWPRKVKRAALEQLKKDMQPYAASGQLQQDPSPAEGGIFPLKAWREWITLPRIDLWVGSWDMAFDAGISTSYVVGQLWGIRLREEEFYLVDQYRAQVDFTVTKAAVRDWAAKRRAERRTLAVTLVEKKANGAAILTELKREIPSLEPGPNPSDSKEARAVAFSPRVTRGSVYLPSMAVAPWVAEFKKNCAKFPNTNLDDEIDAMSQMGACVMGKFGKLARPTTFDPSEGARESGLEGMR